jgi:hypothetical protein
MVPNAGFVKALPPISNLQQYCKLQIMLCPHLPINFTWSGSSILSEFESLWDRELMIKRNKFFKSSSYRKLGGKH